MKKRQQWLTAILVVMMLVTGPLPAMGQTLVTPAMDFPVEGGVTPMPVREGPVAGGQDYVEPGVTPVMSRDRALELGRQALKTHMNMDLTQGNFQLNTEYRKDWQQPDKYVWNLFWNLNDPMVFANASVTLDAHTGQVLDMSHDSGSFIEPQPTQLTLTREEAQGIATGLIQGLLPGRLENMLLRDSQEVFSGTPFRGTTQYNFNFVRVINEIVYDANFVNLSIDGHSGALKWFSQRWDEAPDLPDAQGVMSRAEGERRFREITSLELFYLPLRNEFMYEAMPKEFRLAFRLDLMRGTMINAKTGQPVDWSGKDGAVEERIKDLTAGEKSRIARLAAPITPLNQPMEQGAAVALAQQYARELLNQEIRVQSSNYMEGDQFWESAGRKVWNIDFTVSTSGDATAPGALMPEYSSGRIMVNALTGELIALNWWGHLGVPSEAGQESGISWEEGYDIAVNAIATYHPGRINDIRTMQRNLMYQENMKGQIGQPTEYYYGFPRVINGVLFDENSISISVNAQTGMITNYTDRWSDNLVLPRASEVMNQANALDRLLSNYRMELAYFRYNATDDYMNPTFETKLVYRWTPREATANYPFIDAVSGQFVDFNGRTMPQRDPQGFEANIQGHWVERTARLMAQQGILDTAIFRPNQPITRIDLVKMMVKARGTDFHGVVMEGVASDKVEFIDVPETDEDFRYIQWAIRYGFIDNRPDEFQREAPVTREEAVVMIARFMGYRALASAEGIFRLNYDDADQVTPSAIGAVAIAQGLDVISSGGSFRPMDHTTMAEAAQILFKAVAQRRR